MQIAGSHSRHAGHRAMAAVIAALALCAPTAAYPFSLAHLLQLPLEHLLKLEIRPAAVDGVHRGR